MEKVIKILFSIIVLFILFLLLSQTFKSCNKPESILTSTPIDNPGETKSLPNDDFFESEAIDTVNYFEEEANDDSPDTSVIDYKAIDKITSQKTKPSTTLVKEETIAKPAEKEKSVPTVTSNEKTPEVQKENKIKLAPNPSNTKSSNSPKVMVVTGSFLLKENATKMVSNLKNAGFSKSKTVIFDKSEYHTVVVDNNLSSEEAYSLKTKLNNNGFKDVIIKASKN
jgi:cell division protein FtsN